MKEDARTAGETKTRAISDPDKRTKSKPESNYQRLRYELSKTWARGPLLRLRHRGFNSADVFFGSYPRSGSTWSRFTIFEILTGQEASFESVNAAFRGLGGQSKAQQLLPGGGRFLSTHEMYRSDYRKAMYLVRDGRDVLLSEFAYLKALGRFPGELDDFVGAFLRGKVNGFGAWQRHVSSWLDSSLASTSEMLLVRFEDLRSNPEEEFFRIADFLGVRVELARLRVAIANNSLERMRAKEDRSPQKASVKGRFVRSGSMQKWRTELSQNQLRMIDELAGNTLRRLDYPISTASQELQQV
jgi:Sulfotransferase domain